MMNKCIGKFESFDTARGMDVNELKAELKQIQNYFHEKILVAQ